MINRLKSPIVWLSILSQIVLIVTLYNDSIAEEIKLIGTSVIEMLTIFGILNNPKDKDNF